MHDPQDITVLGPDRGGRSVAFTGGRVVAPPAETAAVRRVPCSDAVIHPGFVNAHTHLYSGLVPLGMPAPDPPPGDFVDILRRIWWRLDRALDADILRAAARYYLAEALLAGTTAVIDHHESPDFIDGALACLAEAATGLGIRAALCYGITERNRGLSEARQGLAETGAFAASDLGRHPLLRTLVGVHASFTVSDQALREAGDLCRSLNTVLHIHCAEGTVDGADALDRQYAGPVHRLMALDALPRGSLLAHGVHLDADQVRLLDQRQCWLIHNPRSNEGNGVGYAANLRLSRHVALGTDGWPSVPAQEIGALQRLGAAHGDTAEALAVRPAAGQRLLADLFDAAADPFAPGALADFVVRSDEEGPPRHVFVDGRQVVVDGGLITTDHTAVVDEAKIEAEKLWQRLA